MITRNRPSSDDDERTSERRPPIVLTTADREKLFALLREVPASTLVEFLREEVERADVATGDVASNSVVRMNSDIEFIDHDDGRIHHAKLVFPDQALVPRCISILSSLGIALIGLGPGQSICWTEQGRERSSSVLSVRADEGMSPCAQRERR